MSTDTILTAIETQQLSAAIAQLRQRTQVSEDDVRGVIDVASKGDAAALSDLMDDYAVFDAPEKTSAWQDFANAILAIAPYAAAGAAILGFVGAARAL